MRRRILVQKSIVCVYLLLNIAAAVCLSRMLRQADRTKDLEVGVNMEAQIYASEWKIMECLWEHAPRTLMQIVKAMREETGWAKSTVTTMVTRMEGKGLLRFEEGGRAKLIFPAVSREEAGRAETDSLLSKIYNGSVGLMVSALVTQKPLSKSEIDALYEILKKAEARTDD